MTWQLIDTLDQTLTNCSSFICKPFLTIKFQLSTPGSPEDNLIQWRGGNNCPVCISTHTTWYLVSSIEPLFKSSFVQDKSSHSLSVLMGKNSFCKLTSLFLLPVVHCLHSKRLLIFYPSIVIPDGFLMVLIFPSFKEEQVWYTTHLFLFLVGAHTHKDTHTHTHTHTHTYMCVCVCVCVCIYIYIYIHTHTFSSTTNEVQ